EEKYYIKKEKEYRDLKKTYNQIELIELPKPIFAGFKRYYTMTDRSNASKYKSAYLKLLEINNGIQYSRTKEFYYKIGKKKIKKEMYIALSYTEYKEIPIEIKHLFESRRDEEYPKFRYRNYYFTRIDIFKVELKKHYITHTILKDGKLESELRKLENELYENRDNYAKLSKAVSRFVNYKPWKHEGKIPSLEKENIKEFFETLIDYS
ncbi:MAG: hypothetical protein KDK36_15900, partial [Leptospiraceae bacterium]|nr:hypothetical protein [Leptospiraceae bacterium]